MFPDELPFDSLSDDSQELRLNGETSPSQEPPPGGDDEDLDADVGFDDGNDGETDETSNSQTQPPTD